MLQHEADHFGIQELAAQSFRSHIRGHSSGMEQGRKSESLSDRERPVPWAGVIEGLCYSELPVKSFKQANRHTHTHTHTHTSHILTYYLDFKTGKERQAKAQQV